MPTALSEITRGAAEVIGAEALEERIAKGKKLIVKVGFDPTAPDLHLGHTVVLTAMRRFQDAGHNVVFLIGDFTARIGDPSGRDTTRPPLSEDEIQANAATYAAQVSDLLDMKKTTVRYNSQWLQNMQAADFVRLASAVTVARILERDDFSRRYRQQKPISLHEFLYPLAQGYDSVALKADVEMGGTEQKFNLLLGRDLQRQAGQPLQAVITWPLLEGTDGVRKMSKSLDNCIAIKDTPDEMFGKLMSISDEMMWRYYELLSLKSAAQIGALKGGHPREAKMALGLEMTGRYHGEQSAQKAKEGFISRFSRGELPPEDAITQVQIACTGDSLLLANAMRDGGMTSGTSEARRLIRQGAVRLDGDKVQEDDAVLAKGGHYLVQVGRRRLAWLQIG